MTKFEAEMIAVAKELLTEFGMAVTIDADKVTGYNPATLTPTKSDVSLNGLAAFFDPSNSSMTGYESNLTADDIASSKWMLLQCDQKVETDFVIITPGGKKFKINGLTSLGPTETTIYYRVMTSEV